MPVGNRSDLASLRAVICGELHRNSEFVDIAIADAIRFVRNEKFWFNGDSHSFLTIADVHVYDLPKDFLSFRGRAYVTPENSDTTGRYPVNTVSADEIETYRFSGEDYGVHENRGIARQIAADLLGKRLLIGPMPSNGGDLIEFKYTKDLGTPVYTVTTSSSAPPSIVSVVTLLNPDGGTLSSTFSNEWFGEGFKLIKERALYELWSRFYGGTEEAAVSAQGALSRFLEEKSRLQGETASIAAPNQVRKYL